MAASVCGLGQHCTSKFLVMMLFQLYFDNIVRSSHLQMFFKISVLKNLSNFTLKHLEFVLIKLHPWRLAILLKRNSDTGVFQNIAKFLGIPFFTEHLWWLFLQWTGYCFVQSWPKQTERKLCRLFSFEIIAVCSPSYKSKLILTNV